MKYNKAGKYEQSNQQEHREIDFNTIEGDDIKIANWL